MSWQLVQLGGTFELDRIAQFLGGHVLARVIPIVGLGALAAALERCPRIAKTREGMRARQLGLSDASWDVLQRSAQDLR
jgi:uncharacterized membrane protein YuzA (DUF378 family)